MADSHNHGGIPADPLEFREAVAALRDRVPMTDALFDKLTEAEREFAFTIANVAQADIVADAFTAIERAVKEGTTFETFKAEVGPALERSWGGEDPAHLENIFRTNVMTAYNQGRYRVMTAPSVKRARPYVRLDVVLDDRTSDDICRPIGKAKVVLPLDHPWIRTHWPPLHHRCRTIPTPLSEDEAKAEGITSNPPDVEAAPGFGAAPSVEGSDWEPEPSDYPAPIAAELEVKLDETG